MTQARVLKGLIIVAPLLLGACSDAVKNGPIPVFRVDVSGSGSGTVVSTQASIQCSITQGAATGTCFATVDSGKTISLSATAASDWELSAWTGVSCAATPACSFTVTRNMTATAGFEPAGGPGRMKLNLSNGAAGAGALILSISGSNVTAVTASQGYQIMAGALGQSPLRILVRGSIGLGTIAELQVANRKATFAVTIIEASAGASGNYAPIAASAFQGSIARP